MTPQAESPDRHPRTLWHGTGPVATPEHAERIVREWVEPHWQNGSGSGTFMIGSVLENDRYYVVCFGAKESLINGDAMFDILGRPEHFVDKASGDIVHPPEAPLDWSEYCEYLDAMRVVRDYCPPKGVVEARFRAFEDQRAADRGQAIDWDAE